MSYLHQYTICALSNKNQISLISHLAIVPFFFFPLPHSKHLNTLPAPLCILSWAHSNRVSSFQSHQTCSCEGHNDHHILVKSHTSSFWTSQQLWHSGLLIGFTASAHVPLESIFNMEVTLILSTTKSEHLIPLFNKFRTKAKISTMS